MVRRGSVTGVRLSDGTEVAAKRIISAAGAIPTSDLLKDGLPADTETYREPGPAHLSLYLGFKGDIARHGAERYCQWYFDTWDMETV
jgi:all-trans-retinol 13,14-reductase